MSEDVTGSLMIAAPEAAALRLERILAAAQITPKAVVFTGGEALRAVGEEGALLLTTYRLPDMTGEELVGQLGEAADVLMIVPQNYVPEEERGNVITLRNPISQDALVQAVRVLCHCRVQLDALRSRVQALTRTLEDRKVIDRAKGRLMDTLHLSEAEAHYRIQKQSMDSGRRIADVAREILAADGIVAC